TAPSDVVDIVAAFPCGMRGQVIGLPAVVHNGTSFKVPTGILQAGVPYHHHRSPSALGYFGRGTPAEGRTTSYRSVRDIYFRALSDSPITDDIPVTSGSSDQFSFCIFLQRAN